MHFTPNIHAPPSTSHEHTGPERQVGLLAERILLELIEGLYEHSPGILENSALYSWNTTELIGGLCIKNIK